MGLLVERRPMGGKPLKGIRWGALAGLGGPNGAHLGPAHPLNPHQACGDSPTLPGWQGWLPPRAYIRRGTPGLLIHQLIPNFSLDLVVPLSEPRQVEEGDLFHHSPLPCCWCSGPSLPLLVLDWSFGGRRLHRMCVTPCEVLC